MPLPLSLGPGFRLGARWNRLDETVKNAQNTGKNGGEMGEIWPKKCEQGRDRRDHLDALRHAQSCVAEIAKILLRDIIWLQRRRASQVSDERARKSKKESPSHRVAHFGKSTRALPRHARPCCPRETANVILIGLKERPGQQNKSRKYRYFTCSTARP